MSSCTKEFYFILNGVSNWRYDRKGRIFEDLSPEFSVRSSKNPKELEEKWHVCTITAAMITIVPRVGLFTNTLISLRFLLFPCQFDLIWFFFSWGLNHSLLLGIWSGWLFLEIVELDRKWRGYWNYSEIDWRNPKICCNLEGWLLCIPSNWVKVELVAFQYFRLVINCI